MSMLLFFRRCVLAGLLGLSAAVVSAADLPDQSALQAWIQEMKTAPRGPFSRLRWFCKDGTILPPRASCRKHGGGAQHGEWSARTKQLRASGYHVANILADFLFQELTQQPEYDAIYKQILLEQFLIAIDDGWIFRRARFYRGALQAEDETEGARRLLLSLLTHPEWTPQGFFLPLRVGVRLLPHGQETSTVAAVRQQSAALSQKDRNFMTIRNKIHVKPDPTDAARVRQYAAKVRDAELKAAFDELASNIDKVYTSLGVAKPLEALAREVAQPHPDLAQALQKAAAIFQSKPGPGQRFLLTGELLADLREALPTMKGGKRRLAALDVHVALEDEHFAAATAVRERLPQATRQQRLSFLRGSASAVYGVGLMSDRQWRAVQLALNRLAGASLPLQTYKTELDYLARAPGWGDRWMIFHFGDVMHGWAAIEPQAMLFIQDQLRSSPLFFYAALLDGLLRDANRLAGVQHELFGEEVGAGLRSLNPGLARGVLYTAPGAHGDFDPQGIYVLPETTSELPPVAGILTAGEGNPLSHVQLLARNLGIPNVGVDASLIPRLTAHAGSRLVLAVSPAGTIKLNHDRGQWDTVFGQEPQSSEALIRPDLKKLDLTYRAFTPTSELRAPDSGRIVGPKAAKLGELAHAHPGAVAPGLAIPFGAFRALLANRASVLGGTS